MSALLTYGAIPNLLECPLCGDRRVIRPRDEKPEVMLATGERGKKGLLALWAGDPSFPVIGLNDWWLTRCSCCGTVLAAENAPQDVPEPPYLIPCVTHGGQLT